MIGLDSVFIIMANGVSSPGVVLVQFEREQGRSSRLFVQIRLHESERMHAVQITIQWHGFFPIGQDARHTVPHDGVRAQVKVRVVSKLNRQHIGGILDQNGLPQVARLVGISRVEVFYRLDVIQLPFGQVGREPIAQIDQLVHILLVVLATRADHFHATFEHTSHDKVRIGAQHTLQIRVYSTRVNILPPTNQLHQRRVKQPHRLV